MVELMVDEKVSLLVNWMAASRAVLRVGAKEL